MNPLQTQRFRSAALASGCLLFAFVLPLRAQESLVGFGKAYHTGVIYDGISPIGATIGSTHPGTGD